MGLMTSFRPGIPMVRTVVRLYRWWIMFMQPAHTASIAQISSAPCMPPDHATVAWSPVPRLRDTYSITAVPHDAVYASRKPVVGVAQDMNRLDSPASVEKLTRGDTIRLAGMEKTGSSGSISTCMGRVKSCAAMVMDIDSAMNSGMTGCSHACIWLANSTMPSTAAQERAKPKLCDMYGLMMSIARVVQHSVANDWLRLPMNRHVVEASPIIKALETESDGYTQMARNVYAHAISNAVARRGTRKNEHAVLTNAAITARWPPLTAMRCSIPDFLNAFSTCLA